MLEDKISGDFAEDVAVKYLRKQGLSLIARNYQPSGRGMADLDIVMQDTDGTVVFIEVRLRSSSAFGGALGSISAAKQKRLIKSAQCFLMRLSVMPSCRFDVVVFEGGTKAEPLWMRHAFEVKNN